MEGKTHKHTPIPILTTPVNTEEGVPTSLAILEEGKGGCKGCKGKGREECVKGCKGKGRGGFKRKGGGEGCKEKEWGEGIKESGGK